MRRAQLQHLVSDAQEERDLQRPRTMAMQNRARTDAQCEKQYLRVVVLQYCCRAVRAHVQRDRPHRHGVPSSRTSVKDGREVEHQQAVGAHAHHGCVHEPNPDEPSSEMLVACLNVAGLDQL